MSQGTTIIYTDGACKGNPGPGGWAFICLTANGQVVEKAGHAAHTTNNKMELEATIQALRHLKDNQTPVQLYLDSQYVIRGITEWINNWIKNDWRLSSGKAVQNQDHWHSLLVLSKNFKIEWHYVPGHKGIIGNERADALAVLSSKNKKAHLLECELSKYPFSITPFLKSEK